MMELLTFANMAALLSLISLELVLGIDNILFMEVILSKVQPEYRQKARMIGLGLAMFFRILLLLFISFLLKLTQPLFTMFEIDFSIKGLILIAGGLFLLVKATLEIHHMVDDAQKPAESKKVMIKSFASAIIQILIIDLIFSLDSVITAVGMTEHVWIMVVSIVFTVFCMLFMAAAIGRIVAKYPTLKMLALAFLLIVGLMLVADGLGQHINRNYLYFAMLFSVFVEFLNIKTRGSETSN